MATPKVTNPIIPVTTGILSSVSQEGNSISLTLDGREVKIVNIVGLVTKFTRDTATYTMHIADNFGSFPCTKYTTGFDAYTLSKYEALSDNTIIRITGDLKYTKKDGCYLSIDNFTVCENLDSLHAHYLEILKMRHASGALSSIAPQATPVKRESIDMDSASTANITPAPSVDYMESGEKSAPAGSMEVEHSSEVKPEPTYSAPAPVPVAAAMSSSMMTSAQAEQINCPQAKTVYTVVDTLLAEAKDTSIESIVAALAERANVILSAEEVQALIEGDELSVLIFENDGQFQI